MVGPARFELTTSCTPCKRSTRLNYGPTFWRGYLRSPAGKAILACTEGFATEMLRLWESLLPCI